MHSKIYEINDYLFVVGSVHRISYRHKKSIHTAIATLASRVMAIQGNSSAPILPEPYGLTGMPGSIASIFPARFCGRMQRVAQRDRKGGLRSRISPSWWGLRRKF